MQRIDTTTEYHTAPRGLDGLAQIGMSKFDRLGLRFIADNDGADNTDADESTDDEVDEDQDADHQDADADEQDSDDDGFEGEFDPKRARALITKLRARIKADAAAKAPKDAPDVKQTQAENLRLRVALATGLDEDLADRLRGNTREELIEDAEKLLARISPAKLEDRTPKVRLRGGTAADKDPETTADDVVTAALGR